MPSTCLSRGGKGLASSHLCPADQASGPNARHHNHILPSYARRSQPTGSIPLVKPIPLQIYQVRWESCLITQLQVFIHSTLWCDLIPSSEKKWVQDATKSVHLKISIQKIDRVNTNWGMFWHAAFNLAYGMGTSNLEGRGSQERLKECFWHATSPAISLGIVFLCSFFRYLCLRPAVMRLNVAYYLL